MLEKNVSARKPERPEQENMDARNYFTPGYPYRPGVDMEPNIPDSCPNKAKVGHAFYSATVLQGPTKLLLCLTGVECEYSRHPVAQATYLCLYIERYEYFLRLSCHHVGNTCDRKPNMWL